MGPDRAEGAGFLEIGLCDAGQDGEAQGHSVPHLHHVQARIEQDDGRKNGVSREAVFQAKQDDAAEQAGGADNPHAAHQHALTVIEYIWIDHQRRYEAGRPQAAHAAGYERGTQSLQNRRPYVLFCKVPCRRVGSCPGYCHQMNGGVPSAPERSYCKASGTRLKQNYAGMNLMEARVYLIEVFVKGGKIEKYIS